jgi:hypothetical protein
MNKIIRIIETPSEKDLSRGWGGLYKVELHSESPENFIAYLSQEEFKLRKFKEELFFKYKVPESVIEKFEERVIENEREMRSYTD